MKMTNLVWPFVLLTAFPACTEIGLDYRKEEGTVVIAPDWSAFACPASACYRFYAAGSEEAAYEGEDASAESFSLVLPVGGYHLLTYNTDARGVAFTGLEHRSKAEVCLTSEAQPGGIYSWSVDNVEVPLRSAVQHTPVPRSLVRQMVLHFRVTGMEEAMVLEGRLNGVYPSVFLLSGSPSAESVAAAPETNTKFAATLAPVEARDALPAYMASADVRLLGLLSPEFGACYDCRLHLQVGNATGETYGATVDMNKTVTDIINSYEGELPLDKTIEVSVGINLLNTVLTAAVKGWTEGSGEGEVGIY